MPTTIKDAIKKWSQKEGQNHEEATEVKLIGMIPPIDTMDETLNECKNCIKLSLSTNQISIIRSLKLRNLQILSLGRNNIKRI
jgi:Leucine-rich repeat (LRR) protein